MPAQIFISYRRGDSNQLVDRLAESLIGAFGADAVYRDTNRLRGGQVWPDELEENASNCCVMLAVIGERWQHQRIEIGHLLGFPKLHDPEDWVRKELLLGLTGQAILIPLLVDGASLPDRNWLCNFGLELLAERQTLSFRSGDDYHNDLQRLVNRLREICPDLPHPPPLPPPPPEPRQRRISTPGLRSFDPADHETYLRLVPGPHDPGGLPRLVARWKHLIDLADAASTFHLAYWYGPSGCGKSSLVKAGLIPTLERHIALYVSADSDAWQEDALGKLRVALELPEQITDLPAAFQWVIAHPEMLAGRKLLLVVDQFERWLHAARGPTRERVAETLRCCDGSHLQALLLVSDDFSSSVHEFLQPLKWKAREGLNYALIPMLGRREAIQVLFEYGRAYGGADDHRIGEWPDDRDDLTPEQQQFLEKVVDSLQADSRQGERIAVVQLALLAQMLKSCPWTLTTYHALGGVRGIGKMFMEQIFGDGSASGGAELHRDAAIRTLESLLPKPGSKFTQKRTRAELLEASGYQERPQRFSELLDLLDNDLKLITPAGGEELERYQLTHDYLIPSIRDWLTEVREKTASTARGRAELQLARREALWSANPEWRHLPSSMDYVKIRLLTRKSRWTPGQTRMMRKASARAAIQGLLAVLLMCTFGGAILYSKWEQALPLVSSTLEDPTEIKATIQRLDGDRFMRLFAVPRLEEAARSNDARGLIAQLLLLATAGREQYASALFSALDASDELDDSTFRAICWLLPRYTSAGELPKIQAQLDSAHRTGAQDNSGGATDDDGTSLERQRIRLGQLRAAMAIAFLRNNEPTSALNAIEGSEDLEAMTQLSLHCKDGGVRATELVGVLSSERKVWERFALLMALGQYEYSEIEPRLQQGFLASLEGWFRRDASSGIHSVTGWLLRRWKFIASVTEIEESLAIDLKQDAAKGVVLAPPGREWFILREKVENEEDALFTFVVFEPGSFEMGSPRSEPGREEGVEESAEHLHPVRLTRRFAICDREVSRWQFEGKKSLHPVEKGWRAAIKYCNELTTEVMGEDQCCYVNRNEKWMFLDRRGLRLPTDAEWEFACRSGTRTPYSFGSDPDVLEYFGAFGDATDVASLRPNLRGVFDLHGEPAEWCSDTWSVMPAGGDDPFVSDPDTNQYVLRGGWISPADARSASRHWQNHSSGYGIRLVLTLVD